MTSGNIRTATQQKQNHKTNKHNKHIVHQFLNQSHYACNSTMKPQQQGEPVLLIYIQPKHDLCLVYKVFQPHNNLYLQTHSTQHSMMSIVLMITYNASHEAVALEKKGDNC